MAYININEVDKTSVTAPTAVQRNTVFVPINSSDGPSDKPVLCTSYEQFMQTFGTDPNTSSSQMTSWEYAANLLLHKMPVMVRRITHYLDSEGNNTVKADNVAESGPLAGVGLASGIITGPNPEQLEGVVDLDATQTFPAKATMASPLINEGRLTFDVVGGTIISVGTENACVLVDPGYNCDISDKSKILSITNTDASEGSELVIPLSLEIMSGSSNLGSIKILNYKVLNNAGVQITDEEGVITNDEKYIRLAYDQTLRIEVAAGDESSSPTIGIQYGGEDVSGKCNQIQYKITSPELEGYCLTVDVLGALDYVEGELIVNLECPRNAESAATIGASSNMTLTNNAGRVNLFTGEYRYAGVNGNKISLALHTVDYDAIYLEVYNGTQRLEQTKLVNLRYKDEDGFWAAYNFTDDAETIWTLLLQNFGVNWAEAKEVLTDLQKTNPSATLKLGDVNSGGTQYLKLAPLTTTYMQISLNPAIPVDDSTYKGVVASVASCTRNERILLAGGSNPPDDCVIEQVPKVYKRLQDKYLYNVKFLANGGYVDELILPTSILKKPRIVKRLVESAMLQCAQTRGDCLAFVDIPLAVGRDDALEYFSYIASSYGTAYAPWVKKALDTGEVKWCPPSFIALETIAKSIEAGNEVYAPPAGVNRGIVTGVKDLSFEIPADYIDYWSDTYTQFINPIVYIDGYGYSIFGQKTLYNIAAKGDSSMGSALQYLNTRLVANEIKKKIFECCIELTFEQNNLHTWLKFSSVMSTLLEKLKTNNAITYYECLMDPSTMTDYDIRTNHIVGTVRVAIGTTAEKFDISFEMIPNSVKYINIDYNESNLTY